MHLLHSYVTKMPLHSIFSLWLSGLRSSLVNCSPLYVQTKGGNFWAKSFKRSFHPEVSLIKHQFSIHSSKTVVQKGSIKLCLIKLKPYDNMLVCLDLSGRTQLKQPCISMTDNPCVIIYGRHLLKYSMETNLIFHISGYLAHMLMCSYPQSSDKTSCLLRPRRWYLLDMNLAHRDIASGRLHDTECSFQLMHYLMKQSFYFVPEIKQMDLPLFLSKKKDQQHMMNLPQRKLEGIQNPLKITIYKFLLVSTTPIKIHQMLDMHLIILNHHPCYNCPFISSFHLLMSFSCTMISRLFESY